MQTELRTGPRNLDWIFNLHPNILDLNQKNQLCRVAGQWCTKRIAELCNSLNPSHWCYVFLTQFLMLSWVILFKTRIINNETLLDITQVTLHTYPIPSRNNLVLESICIVHAIIIDAYNINFQKMPDFDLCIIFIDMSYR